MEESNHKIKHNIEWGENRLVTEDLNSIPRLVSDLDYASRTVEFGNTGFDVRFGSGGNSFDFMPEDKRDPIKEPPAKYASFLAAGLLELYKLLNDKEKMSEFGLASVDASRMSCHTNDYLTYALKNLFSRSSTDGIVRADYQKQVVEVNLDIFKNLNKDNPLIVFLERTSERAHRNTVTYHKNVT